MKNLIPALDNGKTQKIEGHGDISKESADWYAWWDSLTQDQKDEYNARPEVQQAAQAYAKTEGFWN